MEAVRRVAKQNTEVMDILKQHIRMGLKADEKDQSIDLELRIAELQNEFNTMLNAIASDNVEAFDESRAKQLMSEKEALEGQLAQINAGKRKRMIITARLDEIYTITDALSDHPIPYDDRVIRQIIDSIVVETKDKIKVTFRDGLVTEQPV